MAPKSIINDLLAPQKGEEHRPDFVAFGSQEHRDLLGIDQTDDPVQKAKLEQALKATPVVPNKKPITRDTYAATVRGVRGDNIVDGWTRQGR